LKYLVEGRNWLSLFCIDLYKIGHGTGPVKRNGYSINEKAMKSTRGRPRQFDQDAALAHIASMFWEHGYNATSTTDICAALKISAPSLYAAFGSKEEMFRKSLEYYKQDNMPSILAPFRQHAQTRDAVEGFLMASAAAFTRTDRPSGCMILLSTFRGSDANSLGDLVKEVRAASQAALQKRLELALKQGELPRRTNTHALARFFLATQQGMALQARDGASRKDLEAIARSAILAWPQP